MKLIDLTGQRFGRLTVIEKVESYVSPGGDCVCSRWRVRCDCGNEFTVIGRSLRKGVTKSCGCLKSDRLKAMHRLFAEKEKESEAI